MRQIHKTIHQYFPDLFSRIEQFADPRKRKEYSMSELVTASISLFIFRQDSRNELNLSRKEEQFRRNYWQVFKKRLPHMDTVNEVLCVLDENELEMLKSALVSSLIEKKVFSKWRLLGRSYVISVDATHVATYSQDYCGECTWKTLNKGKEGERKLYFQYVLEAKLVTSSGLSISIGSEWVANSGSEFDKQDCEIKAFVRLAAKIKARYPRLQICITGDGLYPNETVFSTCEQNHWDFVITLKDKNLLSIWQEIELRPESAFVERKKTQIDANSETTQVYRSTSDLEYGNRKLNWVQCLVEKINVKTGEIKQSRFVHITNLDLDSQNVADISNAGRMRWKIENEGFNAQKNNGYELGHKFSEVSFTAMKNYYQCLQIAHLINQLVEHSTTIANLLKEDKTLTIKFLWRKLISFMDEGKLELLQKRRCQIRLI